MENRDDDDNESAVRALNTAMNTQAESLKILQDDPLMSVHVPFDEQPPSRTISYDPSRNTNAPSDETHSYFETISQSDSSDVVGVAIVTNDTPAPLLGAMAPLDQEEDLLFDGEYKNGIHVDDIIFDGEDNDGMQDEEQQLAVSEHLLRQEMERVSEVAAQNSTIEQLSSNLWEATEAICAPDAPASVEEIRTHMEEEKKKKSGCTTIQAMTINGMVESVMDTVMDSCQGCPNGPKGNTNQDATKEMPGASTVKGESDVPGDVPGDVPDDVIIEKTPTDETETDIPAEKPSPSNSLEQNSLVRKTSSNTLTDQEKAFVVQELHNARSMSRQQRSSSDIPSDLHEGEELSDIPNSVTLRHDRTKRGSSVGVEITPDFRRNTSISDGSMARKSPMKMSFMAQSLAGLIKSDHSSNRESEKDVTVCVAVGKSSMLTPLEASTSASDQKQRRSSRSLLDRAKSLSSWRSSMGGKNIARGEPNTKTNEIAESHTATGSTPEYDQEAAASVASDNNVEDQGQEVDAYQTKATKKILKRVDRQSPGPGQRRDWKKEIFEKEWLGIKRFYWVAFGLLALAVLLTGILILVTMDESEDTKPSPLEELPLTNSKPIVDTASSGPGVDPLDFDTHPVFEDPSSPQAKAYEWLVNDPSYHQYSDDRKIQRYSLATLYYSTNGPNWTYASRVLTYDSDECQWFYRRSEGRTPPAACAIAGGLIETLMLDDNNLEGTLPPELWLLTNLKYLSLSNNQLASTIPSEGLEKLTDLQFLGISKSGLSGPLPPTLGYLKNLELLDLSSNRITGTIPLEFRDLSNLSQLRLHRNGLNGTLPGVVLSGMRSLSQLYLFQNTFSGPVPSDIRDLQELEDLFLYSNNFSSTLPSELGLLTRLQRVWLDRNRFSGQIPKELGSLHMMAQLSLFSNKLTGTIPSSLGNARSLEQIRLSDNLLQGEVPERLCSLLPDGGDNDIVRILSVDCTEVACDCNCNCPRPGSEDDKPDRSREEDGLV